MADDMDMALEDAQLLESMENMEVKPPNLQTVMSPPDLSFIGPHVTRAWYTSSTVKIVVEEWNGFGMISGMC
jgi:hypothetical protein